MTQKGLQLDGHGLTDDGRSCRCGRAVDSMEEFSKHCATVQRRSEQPMDVKHTASRY